MNKTINIDNLKCTGCANSIKKNLNSIKGINDVSVDLEQSSVSIQFIEKDGMIEEVLRTLKSMGYAEAGTSNFVDKAKSYVSCAVGRMTDEVE